MSAALDCANAEGAIPSDDVLMAMASKAERGREPQRMLHSYRISRRGGYEVGMSLFNASVPQLSKMLKALDSWLEKGAAHAKAAKFEPGVLLESRLYPNQYPLVRQVQSACDTAKFAAARITNQDPPKHPDTETTMEQLHERIQSVIAYLGKFTAQDFEGADQRVVPLSFMEGKGLNAGDYLNEMVLPNFYFHLAHAYAILRHNGVELGKQDFLASLNIRDLA